MGNTNALVWLLIVQVSKQMQHSKMIGTNYTKSPLRGDVFHQMISHFCPFILDGFHLDTIHVLFIFFIILEETIIFSLIEDSFIFIPRPILRYLCYLNN